MSFLPGQELPVSFLPLWFSCAFMLRVLAGSDYATACQQGLTTPQQLVCGVRYMWY